MRSPFDEKLIFTTNLSLSEVKERLNTVIERDKMFRFFSKSKKYEGTLIGNKFRIQRIIIGNRTNQAQITGEIFEAENGTVIQVRIWLYTGAVIIWGFMALIFLSGFLLLVIYSFVKSQFNGGIFLPLVGFIFLVGGTALSFDSEIEKFTENMQELLDAKIQNEEE